MALDLKKGKIIYFMKHIAIFRQPFFDMVLNGKKTIESRWAQKKVAPYQKVKVGDEILLKETSKDVTATAKVTKVLFFELTPQIADEIKEKYGKEIGIDKFNNWDSYKNKKYCTLIWLNEVKTIPAMKVKKSNGAGWLIIK